MFRHRQIYIEQTRFFVRVYVYRVPTQCSYPIRYQLVIIACNHNAAESDHFTGNTQVCYVG